MNIDINEVYNKNEKEYLSYMKNNNYSVYHKPSDLLTIPIFIKELILEYKLALRHHSSCLFKTILYCYAYQIKLICQKRKLNKLAC